MFIKLIISLLIWIFYLELSPELGGIWIRLDDTGQYNINLFNIVIFIMDSLQIPQIWSIEFLWENFVYAIPSIYTFVSLYWIMINEFNLLNVYWKLFCGFLWVMILTSMFFNNYITDKFSFLL